MQFASSGRSPLWLLYGFGSACEKAALGNNHVGISLVTSINGRTIENHWDEQVMELKRASTLQEWEEFFSLSSSDYGPAEFQQAYSIVSFLFEPHPRDEERPKRFLHFVDLIAGGMEATTAIELVYEKEIDVLQNEWLAWIDTRSR